MKQTKVCHLTSVHPAKDGRIFYKECNSLAKAGYDVTLICAGAEDEVCNGVKIVGVPKASGRLGRMFKTTNNVYKKALEIDADIYHLHDPELLPIGLKLKKRGKKVIFDSHECVALQILSKNYIPKVLRKSISTVYKGIETYICKRIDAVIEICTLDSKDYFCNRCKRRAFITNAPIIPSDIEIKPYENLNLKRVVHIGGLTYDRGITHLANAIIMTDSKLILAGKFSSDDYSSEIKSLCGPKLDYKGVLPASEIQHLLSECGIGTGTLLDMGQYSHIDVLPTKLYEYMLAGMPIIISDFPFLRKFNKKYKVGLCVDPSKPEDIANAVTYLNEHPEEAKQMGRNGRKAVLEELNWESQEKILLNLYETLINEHTSN